MIGGDAGGGLAQRKYSHLGAAESADYAALIRPTHRAAMSRRARQLVHSRSPMRISPLLISSSPAIVPSMSNARCALV
jgi:hypothetical protein